MIIIVSPASDLFPSEAAWSAVKAAISANLRDRPSNIETMHGHVDVTKWLRNGARILFTARQRIVE